MCRFTDHNFFRAFTLNLIGWGLPKLLKPKRYTDMKIRLNFNRIFYIPFIFLCLNILFYIKLSGKKYSSQNDAMPRENLPSEEAIKEMLRSLERERIEATYIDYRIDEQYFPPRTINLNDSSCICDELTADPSHDHVAVSLGKSLLLRTHSIEV